MKNNMLDLRNHLFEVIERLKDPQPETPMDIPTASAIVDVARTLIESARVENQYIELQVKMHPNGMPEQTQKEVKAISGWIGDPSR